MGRVKQSARERPSGPLETSHSKRPRTAKSDEKDDQRAKRVRISDTVESNVPMKSLAKKSLKVEQEDLKATTTKKLNKRLPSPEKSALKTVAVTEVDVEEELLGGFESETSEADSSDEEMDEGVAPIKASSLPTMAKDDALIARRLEKAKKTPVSLPGFLSLCLIEPEHAD